MHKIQHETTASDSANSVESIPYEAALLGQKLLNEAVKAAADGDMRAFTSHLAKVLKNQTDNGLVVPKHQGHDETLFRLANRLDAHIALLQDRGGIHCGDAAQALIGDELQPKQLAAQWLRKELRVLRGYEKQAGSSPTRRNKALPRIEIADIAMTMLESLSSKVGDDLTCLLQELLDVDRHRKGLAQKRNEVFDAAASTVAANALIGTTLGVRQLARMFSVSPATAADWTRSPSFQYQVKVAKMGLEQYFRREYFPQIKTIDPTLSDQEAFWRAFTMHSQKVLESLSRSANESGDATNGSNDSTG